MGSSFTLTHTFTVSSTAAGGGNGCSASAHFDKYTATIYAQPYNYHQTSVTDDGSGQLIFTYKWLSTDGNLADLDPSCLVHEYVTYPGGNPYTPPLPFFLTDPNTGQHGALANPTIAPYKKGSEGTLFDHQLLWGTVAPYTSQSVPATQTYEFDDSATGQTNQPIPGPDSGPLSITRTVGSRIPYTGTWYSVTKNNSTAWLQLSSH